MKESAIEKKCREYTEENDGMLIKLLPFIMNGLPDRIVILKRKPIFFVEMKKPNKEPRKLQDYIHQLLRLLGQCVYVVDNLEEFKNIIDKHKKLPDYDFGTTGKS